MLNRIIVFDDVFTYPKLNWRSGSLLKVLGHEVMKVDVKYRVPIEIPPTNSIIFSNKLDMFTEPDHKNLQERVMTLGLGKIPEDD